MLLKELLPLGAGLESGGVRWLGRLREQRAVALTGGAREIKENEDDERPSPRLAGI